MIEVAFSPQNLPVSRILIVLALAVVPLAAQPAAPGDLLYARFERFLEALRAQTGIPGMVAVVVGESGVVWERTFGRRDQERALPMQVDTPFHVDGLTQLLTATLTLQCVEQGIVELEDELGAYDSGAPEPNATVRHLLTHTRSTPGGGLVYGYDPPRLDPLNRAIRDCTNDSYRENVANLLDQLSMSDSVPGIDVVTLAAPAEGIPTVEASERYRAVLERMTTSYVLQGRQAVAVPHGDTTLTPSAGLITTARDLAKFDVALKQGSLLTPETLASAWTLPAVSGQPPVPHGMGWFVQHHDGETIVWQFGVSAASSSFMMSLPRRRLTMILLANSSGLVAPFVLTPGDVTASPFARVFLGLVNP